ncbi:MAG: helix-turn-helix domain-containing protein [Ostreibacterium sp.]
MDKEVSQLASIDIGDMLASKRSSMGVSIKNAAKMVKLSVGVIENLESNQFTQVGTAVYVRGYLGLYAKYLNLDAAEMIQLYDSQYPCEIPALKPSNSLRGNRRQQSKRHSKTLSFVVSVAILVGLLYGYTQLEPLFFTEKGKVDAVVSADVALDNVDDRGVNKILAETADAQHLADDVLKGLPVTGQNANLVTDLMLPSINTNEDKEDVSVTLDSTQGIAVT